MKRILSTVLTGCAALTLLVVIQGCGVLGGPPTGVAVSAGPGESDSTRSDTTVLVSWTTPAEGSPDKYQVFFRALTDTGYKVLGETTATSYVHNPHGMTGQYKVAALFGTDAYEAAEKPTTVPVRSEAALFEINTDSSHCGFGWSRDSGIGKVSSMIDSANCAFVDLYVSDLVAGTGEALRIVSPNKATDTIDKGAIGIVPRADWRANGFSDHLPATSALGPLPRQQNVPANYFIYTEIIGKPCYIAFYNAKEDVKHYALVQVDSSDVISGKVWMQSWFQLVPDLSLIRH